MDYLADAVIHGDLGNIITQLRYWGPTLAGGLFGAGWWCWADSLVHLKATEGHGYPFKYNWPGIIATVALILINVVPRDALTEISGGMDRGAETRARLWLLVSFLIAFAAVGGSIAVLIATSGLTGLASVGVGSVLQCGLILASALLFWGFRTGDNSGYDYL